MTTYENQIIQSFCNKPRPNYETLGYYHFYGGYHGNPNHFIQPDGLHFSAYVGDAMLTGTELVYYPKLARKLRALSDYPILKRIYPIEKMPCGIEVVKRLSDCILLAHEVFQRELKEASFTAHELLMTYGNKRKIPIIEDTIIETSYYNTASFLNIHGLQWRVEPIYATPSSLEYEAINCLDTIDPHKLFLIPYRYKVRLVDAIINTPFIALNIAKTYGSKGKIYWYSLETCGQASKRDIQKWWRSAQ